MSGDDTLQRLDAQESKIKEQVDKIAALQRIVDIRNDQLTALLHEATARESRIADLERELEEARLVLKDLDVEELTVEEEP